MQASKGQYKGVKSPAAAGLHFHVHVRSYTYQAVSLPQHNKQIDEQFNIILGYNNNASHTICDYLKNQFESFIHNPQLNLV